MGELSPPEADVSTIFRVHGGLLYSFCLTLCLWRGGGGDGLCLCFDARYQSSLSDMSLTAVLWGLRKYEYC